MMVPRRAFPCLLSGIFLLLFCPSSGAQSAGARLAVTDPAGAAIAEARLTLHSPGGSLIREVASNSDGRYIFTGLPEGSYLITITAPGFAPLRTVLKVGAGLPDAQTVTLTPSPLPGHLTVTAQRGVIEEVESAAAVVSVKDDVGMHARPLATIGNALEGVPGVLVQQSTYAQVSPFLRGLTGYQVLNLIDGIRFNNSTFRSGPNQYLAFVEPSQAQRLEVVLGPTGALYGSDALGGTINLLTNPLDFSGDRPFALNGEARAFAASADASGGSNLKVGFGMPRLALMAGGSWRRHNDLRAGGGGDSRHVFHRFFGLTVEQIKDLVGSRQQDTGFTQYGWQAKLAAALSRTQSLTAWYQRSVQEGVRGYKDLWGGLGRLRSDFAPQQLDFFYTRYEKLGLGWLDALSGSFSINSQRDGSVRQNLNATDRITSDDNEVTAYGYAAQATTHVGNRQTLVFGGEVYDEKIRASRFETLPVTSAVTQKRALYPNGSRYTTFGLFAQHAAELMQARVRLQTGGRYTRVGFRTVADQNLSASGASLGVTDASETYQDVTFHTALTWRITPRLSAHGLVGRGFRAPNLNDLGALGLNDLGYEIPASDAVAAGALVGASDGEGALAEGRKVAGLKAERLYNYEVGVAWKGRKVYARAQVFDAELKDPILRRTLLFPATGIPAVIGGVAVQPIPATEGQRAQGVVPVATAFDPRAVKAFVNAGESKYYGGEAVLRYAITPRWLAEGNYTFIGGRERKPDRFLRRLPPQQGVLAIRYQPGGRISWLELSGEVTGPQERLSGGDLTDERIGAARRRRDIQEFFNGAVVRGFLDAGADHVVGTADDRFRPTGETLAQISDRVLPLGAPIDGVGGARITDDNVRVPLYGKTAGYGSLHLRGGLRLTERVGLNFALMNLLDKNYRVHGSGVDAPGINLFVGLRYSF